MDREHLALHLPEINASVSGVLDMPDAPACIVLLAHGAGAGMLHPFMQNLASGLCARNMGVLRFNFLYMERGRRLPDSPRLAKLVLTAAIAHGASLSGEHGVPLIAAGKSFGGRMFSQLAAENSIRPAAGLVFYGFPLHPPGKPGTERADHLENVRHPMLFLQGTRDRLASQRLVEGVIAGMDNATLKWIEEADHGFKVLKRSGITQEQVLIQLVDMTSEWVRGII